MFWGHKILRNLHRRFVLCTASQIYGGDFAKNWGLLRIYELYYSRVDTFVTSIFSLLWSLMASSTFDWISPKLLRFMKIIAKMTTMAIFLNPASRNIAPGKLSMVWRSELYAYITSAKGQFLLMFSTVFMLT